MNEADILAEIGRLLARGVADRRSVFHTPTIVTVDAAGEPCARTVVLRGWNAGGRALDFHTDIRSAKIAQLRARPAIALHAYDAGARVQLRALGQAAIHHDDPFARAAWDKLGASSSATYRVVEPPGSVVADPATVRSTGLEEAAAYANFAVVRMAVTSFEWLSLAATGHRRLGFSFPRGAPRATWLVP